MCELFMNVFINLRTSLEAFACGLIILTANAIMKLSSSSEGDFSGYATVQAWLIRMIFQTEFFC